MDFNFNYILLATLGAVILWRVFKSYSARKLLPALLKEGALIIDVRSPEEFATGHAPGSLNYPLTSLADKVKALDRDKPIILCCASGVRSGSAVSILRQQGFQSVTNGGSWRNLDKV